MKAKTQTVWVRNRILASTNTRKDNIKKGVGQQNISKKEMVKGKKGGINHRKLRRN
jgi:hypothetical protein